MSPAEPRRALLLLASIGGGHALASAALAQALRDRGVAVTERDYLQLVPAWLRVPSLWTYRLALRRWPGLWRAYYRLNNRPRARAVSALTGAAGVAKMESLLAELRPDLVVSTFNHAVALAGQARRRRGLRFLNVAVVTDFRPHRHWARPEADLLVAPTAQARADLLRCGASPGRVQVVGVPLRAAFAAPPPRATARRGLGLDERPVVLVCGGLRPSPAQLQALVRRIVSLGQAAQVLLCAGAPAPPSEHGAVRVLRPGVTADFPRLLQASDLLVGKAGGLTVAEALAAGVPMLVCGAIPGQEEGNAAFLEAEGAGVWARDEEALLAQLRALLAEPGRLMALGAAARRLGAPDAAPRTAALLLSTLAQGGAR